ncbi:MAG: type II toxin-antitoxin system VapB family antitoxin [Propionibacteriaceae bacterium]|jgi:Arc/MetJ family transcription regulator|nr:type II toxin-antitoxin system VapB family antitoxin [Propionibacteriaceae bacterium]
MRTNIEIDDPLMDEAMMLSGLTTKRAVVTTALQEFVAKRKRRDLRDLAGQVEFVDGYDHKALRVGKRP